MDIFALVGRIENLEQAVFGKAQGVVDAPPGTGQPVVGTQDAKISDLQALVSDAKNKGQQYLADLEGLGIAILLQEPDKFTIDTKGSPLVIAVGSGSITINGSITVDYVP